VVARVEALLSDLPHLYCRYDFSVRIELSLIEFVPYSFSPLLRIINDGIGSFWTTVIGGKAMVAQVEALLSDLPPFYYRYAFSVYIALSLI
jgi:hypothetical protein